MDPGGTNTTIIYHIGEGNSTQLKPYVDGGSGYSYVQIRETGQYFSSLGAAENYVITVLLGLPATLGIAFDEGYWQGILDRYLATLTSCTIQSSHFTKNGDANFDCTILPGDALSIDVMVSGLGMYFVWAEYEKPDGTKNTLRSEPHYLNNEMKTWSMVVPDVVPGQYRITQVAVFDNDSSVEKCSAVY